MEISVTQTGAAARIVIKGHIDERGAEVLKARLTEINVRNIQEITFDFREVTRIGSAGIGQLLLLYKKLAVAGATMRVENVSVILHELFQGLKLDTLFTITRA